MSDPKAPGQFDKEPRPEDTPRTEAVENPETDETAFRAAVLELAADTKEDYLEEYAEDEAKQPETNFDLDDIRTFLTDLSEGSGQDVDNLSAEQVEFVTSVLRKIHEGAHKKAQQMFAREKREEAEGKKIRELKKKIESGEIEPEEEITEKEKVKRAKAMASDMIAKTKDPILKQQREEAMARFVKMIIPAYDQEGWTLPQSIFVEGSDERRRVRTEIVERAKEGTGLM